MDNLPFQVNSVGPNWLPSAAVEARKFAYWGNLFLFVMFIIDIIGGIINLLITSWASAVYLFVCAAVCMFLMSQMPKTVFGSLDQGRYKEASEHLLIWGIVAVVFGPVLPGLFLLLAFVTLQGVFQQQYQQYPTQYYQQPQQYPQQAPPPQQPAQAPPQQYQAPPPQAPPQQPQPAAPAPAPEGQHKSDMTKCKNCGASYPSFMRNCPNCGAPR